jgi:hypothetical protein
MIMAKKQKQTEKTCADCIHESACRVWTDGRYISDAAATQCPNHETVKESGAYLCGVLDERKRKQTNADRIRAMSDEELADFLGMSSICQRIQQEGTWCEDHGSCSDCLREWLEQHAEEVR